MLGAGAWACILTMATSFPHCANAISLSAVKNPSLSKNPFPFGSDSSQI